MRKKGKEQIEEILSRLREQYRSITTDEIE
jgi:hypothetical protein